MQPSDKELDKLAGDAAEKLEAPGALPDWEAMSALLEKELPEQEDRRRRPVLWFILLLFLGAGGYLFINSPRDTQTANKRVISNNSNKPSTVEQSTTAKPSTQPTPEKNSDEGNATPGIQSTINPGSIIPSQPEVKNASSHSRKRFTGKKAASLKITTSPGNTGDAEAPTVAKNNIPETDQATQTTTEPSKLVVTRDDQVPPAIPPASAPVAKNDTKQIITVTGKAADSASPASAKETIKKKNRARFEISLLYAPELTTIGFTDIDKPGSSFGWLVGYHLSDRIMVQTGVIKSKKNYTAEGKDYKLHYTVPYPYKLAEVTGFCHMYEVPINVKYQITNSKKINTSVIGGLSSYFMTRESYVYKYTSSYNSYDRKMNDASQKNYWLSLATVGVGFEKDLSKSIKAGATPYIKIPFKGMGTGELKLISTGINFSLTYRPSFTR